MWASCLAVHPSGMKFSCIKILVLVIQVCEIAAKFRKGVSPFSPAYTQPSSSIDELPPPEGAEEEFLEIHHSLFDFIITAIAVPMTFLAMRTFDPAELRRLAVIDPASASLDSLLTPGSKDPEEKTHGKTPGVGSMCPAHFPDYWRRPRQSSTHAVQSYREAEQLSHP